MWRVREVAQSISQHVGLNSSDLWMFQVYCTIPHLPVQAQCSGITRPIIGELHGYSLCMAIAFASATGGKLEKHSYVLYPLLLPGLNVC